MRKNLTLRFLATFAVAMLFSFGANAQILTDYVQATAGAEAGDTVTTGTTTRLYVLPDPVFSPSYNATANTGLGTNQRWTWSSGVTKAAANENWIEQTWGAAGTVTVVVTETNTGLSCDDGGQTIDVEVIDESTVTFTSVDGSNVFGSAAAPFNFCETDLRLGTDAVQATFTNADLPNSPSYQIQYSLAIDTSHNGGGSWTNIPALAQTYSGAPTVGTQQAVTGTTHNLTAPAGGFVAFTDVVNYPTRYTYTISGVTDRISRKSDYLSNSALAADSWTWYDTGAETLVIVVNPTPVTGPIYHISNMWAN